MEAFREIVEKGKLVLSAIAMAGAASCVTEGSNQDRDMEAALISVENETNELVAKFEAALNQALGTGQVFEEVGNSTGEAILIKDDIDTFGCINGATDDGLLCEEARLKFSSTNPNQVYLDRNDGNLVVVGNDLQITRSRPGKPQNMSKIFLNDTSCEIHDSRESVAPKLVTSNPTLLKRCVTLRDNLKKRLANFMTEATKLKTHAEKRP